MFNLWTDNWTYIYNEESSCWELFRNCFFNGLWLGVYIKFVIMILNTITDGTIIFFLPYLGVGFLFFIGPLYVKMQDNWKALYPKAPLIEHD